MVFWATFCLRALPRGPSPGEELAKQEVPEGDSREEVQCVNGNRISTRKVSAFIRWLRLREASHWSGTEKGFRRRPLLAIKPERKKGRRGSGSELAETLQILSRRGMVVKHTYYTLIPCM